MAILHLLPRVNEALEINPPAGDSFLSVNGSNWLWTVTAIFTISFVLLAAHTYFARLHERIFHYLFLIGTLVGAIAYFAVSIKSQPPSPLFAPPTNPPPSAPPT